MKTHLKSLLRTITLSSSIVLAGTLCAHSAEYLSVSRDGVNVRTGPSTDKPVYMELFKGYPLAVLERNGEWVKISDFEKDSGWIHSSLTTTGNTVIVSAKGKVNMRSGPGTKNGIVANIERGVVLDLLERQKSWVKVRHLSGTEGWIYAPLVWP